MTPKIDLTLLKRLVAELTTAVNEVDAMIEQKTDTVETVVALAKTSGYLGGITQESVMLLADLQAMTKILSQPQAPKANGDLNAFLDKLLGAKNNPNSSKN